MTVKDQLDGLTGAELEAVVAQVWEARGWQTERVGNGDRGVDVRATKTVPYPETEVIQVKHRDPEATLGAPDVQQYTGLEAQEDADKALLVTNTTFTEEAHDRATRAGLKLIDGETLADLVTDHGPPERYEPHLNLAAPAAGDATPDPVKELTTVALDTTRDAEEREEAIRVLGNFGDDAVPALARIANDAQGGTMDSPDLGADLRALARERIDEITA